MTEKMRIIICGHAPKGNEDVCATTTMLIDNLAGLLNEQEYGNRVILGKGYGELISEREENIPYFSFVIRGINLLATGYPNCIRVG